MRQHTVVYVKFCEAAENEMFSDIMAAIVMLASEVLHQGHADGVVDVDQAIALIDKQIRRHIAELDKEDVAAGRFCQ